MLSLNLAKIRTPDERVEREYQPEAFEGDPDVYRVVAPVSLGFDIHKDKDTFHLVGRVTTTVELGCGRCLEPFQVPVDAPFDLRYEPLVAAAGGGEHELRSGDFDTALYENDEIDLGQLMQEQIFLTLPMKPLCTEGCRGLCPSCGTNLNKVACDCQTRWEDPRLAALQALKKES